MVRNKLCCEGRADFESHSPGWRVLPKCSLQHCNDKTKTCKTLESLCDFEKPLLSGDFRKVYLNIVEKNITMQRFLDVSRFLYSGGWRVFLLLSGVE